MGGWRGDGVQAWVGSSGRGVRLRKVDVLGIGTMHLGRGDTVGEIVWISGLEFCALCFASRRAMLFLQTGGRISR